MQKTIYKSVALLAMGAGIFSCARDTGSNQPPNILFIMTDDHTQQAIHAYGHGLLDSVLFPNIDRLAQEGALFRQSFVTNSICAPSRAVMLTGKYSHLNGQLYNSGSFDWDQANFPKLLQKAGYQTALIGKIHLDGEPQGFDYYKTLPGQGQYYNPVFIENGERKEYHGHCSPLTTEFALEWLENIRDKDKPFTLLYHHKAPHRNWQAETKYLDFLEDHEFALPHNFFDDYKGRGTAAREQEMEILHHMYWGIDMKFERDPYTGESDFRFDRHLDRMTSEQREAWDAVYGPLNEAFLDQMPEGHELASFMFNRYLRDYLKSVKSVDDGIGEVLSYLEKAGILENTVVIYTSDQGFFLGEHGWYDKRFMYEQSLSTPLLVRYPREIAKNTEVSEMVINLDLAPTMLDYAGIEKPVDMQGKSFREIAAGKKMEWRDAIYYHYYEYPRVHMVKRHYGIRTERYKLIHFYYDIDEWEMYDLKRDPDEMNSVYNDSEYIGIQEALKKRLGELRIKYGDSDELSKEILEAFLNDNS